MDGDGLLVVVDMLGNTIAALRRENEQLRAELARREHKEGPDARLDS